jgi:hypothetical protein
MVPKQMQTRGISQEESPIAAIKPVGNQATLLSVLMKETLEYAWSKGYTDFNFQDHPKYKYFCAYKSRSKRRGWGAFVFGFERKPSGLYFVYPDHVADPFGLSSPWEAKPGIKRRKIVVGSETKVKFWSHIIDIALQSIDLAY